MDKRLEKDDFDEETNNFLKPNEASNRRSSILKQTKVQNDESTFRSNRRVSFNRNFIKKFTTDADRNTIWDSTLEELLSGNESSKSHNSKHSEEFDLDTTLFTGRGDSSEELEEKSRDESVPFLSELSRNPADSNMELTQMEPSLRNADISRSSDIMEFTCVNPILNTNNRKATDPAETSTMQFTCMHPTLNLNDTNTSRTSETMEFTCVNPVLASNDAEVMDFTCANPVQSPNNAEVIDLAETSATMEFTCVNTPLNQSYAKDVDPAETSMQLTCLNPNNAEVIDSAETSVAMEFTCLNRTLDSKHMKANVQAETSTMQFTCLNPTLNQSNIKVIDSDETSMQFTCVNPTLNPNNAKGIDPAETSTMQFTCVNPTLNPGNVKVTDPADTSTMQFTCVNPTLNARNVEVTDPDETSMQFTCVNPTLNPNHAEEIDPAETSMQFICVNPTLNPGNGKVTDPADTSTMQFTCVNPTLTPSNVKVTDPAETSMQFTCVNPTLHPRNVKVTDPDETSMQFTCVNPTLNPDHAKEIDPAETSMQFICVNPTLNPGNVKVTDPADTSTMQFTCVNPTLNPRNVEVTDPDETSMQFTSVNPTLNPKHAKGIDSAETSTMQFTCVNPTLNPGNVKVIYPAESSMQFTCVNATLNQSHVKVIDPADASTMQFTCVNPTLNPSNVEVIDPADASTMQFTCVNSTLNPRNVKVADPADTSTMQFTCVNPTLNPSHDDDKSIMIVSDRDQVKQPFALWESKSNTDPLLCGMNISLEASSFCNADDTQQLLKDASRLNHTKNITCTDISLDNVSATQINKTYRKDNEGNIISNEAEAECIEPNEPVNVGGLIREESIQSTEIKWSPCKENTNIGEKIDNEQHIETLSNCLDEIHGNSYICDTSSADLVELEKSADEIVETKSNESKENIENNFEISEKLVAVQEINDAFSEPMEKDRKSSHYTKKELLQEDFSVAEFIAMYQNDVKNFEKILDSIRFDDDAEVERFQVNSERFNKLRDISEKSSKIISEKYSIFKKQLDDVLEYCQNNQFVPEELSEDEDAQENDTLENTLPAKIGIFQMIEEKSQTCENSWKLIQVEDGVAKFLTFFQQIEITLEFSPHDYRVGRIETNSLLSDKAKPRGVLLQKEFLRLLSTSHIHNSIGRHYNILSLLDYIQIVMDKIRKLYVTLKELEKSYDLQFTDGYKAYFMILDENLLIKWNFTVDLSELENINRKLIDVTAEIGKVNTEHVLSLVSECPKGLEFLKGYVDKVEQYLETLRKRKKLIQLKDRPE